MRKKREWMKDDKGGGSMKKRGMVRDGRGE